MAARREDEDSYRRHFLGQDTRAVVVLIGLGIIAHLLFIRADSLFLRGMPAFHGLLALRLGMVAWSAGVVAILLRNEEPLRLDRWSFAWALTTVLVDSLIILTRPSVYAGHVAVDLVLIIALHAIQPGPTLLRMLPPLLLTANSLCLYFTTKVFMGFVASMTTVSTYVAANAIGWLVAANWHRYRRSSFVAHRALERLYHQSEERRRAAEAADQRWERIFNTSPALLLFIDRDYRICRINQTTINRLGLPREEIIGQPCYQLLCGHSAPPADCLHRRAITDGQEQRTETVLLPDKAECRVTAIPLFDTAGAFESVFYAIEEISEQRRFERELLQARERYRTLVQHSHGIIYTIRPDGVITYVSPSYTKQLGYPPNAIIGKSFQHVVHPDDVAACEAFQREILAKGEVSRGIEYRLLHRDGSIHWHLSNFLPSRDEHGNIVSFVGNAMDITEQKRYQAELDQARKAAERADRGKSDFLALVSHEIRTPLNAIVGFSALARRTTEPDRLREYMEILDQSALILMDLVNDILDMSKVEAGQLQLESIPFNVPDAVDLLQWQFAPLAAKKNIVLQVRKGDDLPVWALGDPMRFRQIVSNLLSNAIKFTTNGVVVLEVGTLPPAPDDDRCRIRVEVQDSGIGIDPAHLDGLFQPFQQVDPGIARKYGGTGLGLAIVRRLVELMDGQITVASEVGQGSSFTVHLPFLPSPPPQYEQMAPESTAPLQILVVEDNEFNRRLLHDTLQSWGHAVVEAEDGLQALDILDTHRFDCVILDVRMPEMDGVELTVRLRQLERMSHVAATPVIAYTADVEEATRVRCLAVGMQAVLFKPLDPRRLAETIGRCCRKTVDEPSEPAPSRNGGGPLNEHIVADMGHDAERIAAYLQLLRDDIETELNRLDQALLLEDRQGLREAAHSLKGLCGYLHDPAPGALAVHLHNGASSLPFAEVHALVRQARRVCTRPFTSPSPEHDRP
jgi:PAS domain S-box-containing protein